MRFRALAIGCVLSVLIDSRVAAAQVSTPPPVVETLGSADDPTITAVLRWSAPEHCGDAEALRDSVRAILERDAFVSESADVSVIIRVTRTLSGHEATLVLESEDGEPLGERTISVASSECAELAAPLALVTALMVDVPRREIRERIERARARLRGTVALGGGITDGWVPGGPSFVGELRVGIRVERFALELVFIGIPEGSVRRDGGSVKASLLMGALAVCGTPLDVAPVSVGLCAELGAGALMASGAELAEVRSAIRPQAMVGLLARTRIELIGALGLRIEAGIRVPIVHDRLEVSPVPGMPETLFTAWAIAPHTAISLDFEL